RPAPRLHRLLIDVKDPWGRRASRRRGLLGWTRSTRITRRIVRARALRTGGAGIRARPARARTRSSRRRPWIVALIPCRRDTDRDRERRWSAHRPRWPARRVQR